MFKKFLDYLHKKCKKVGHYGHVLNEPAHCIYFGMVAVEAHYTYGYAAGALLLLTIIAILFGGD